MDDAESGRDGEFGNEVEGFLLDFFEWYARTARLVEDAGGDIKEEEDAFAGRVDAEEAHAGSAESSCARTAGARSGAHTFADAESVDVVADELRGVEWQGLIHCDVGQVGKGECGGACALHAVGECGLRRGGVEGGHIHLLL
ncbi:MAG: hypothetical protein EBY32_09995 [Proteobacteria bacterium]|nr:hypothetical protein [Pseudomonadota bacterium]